MILAKQLERAGQAAVCAELPIALRCLADAAPRSNRRRSRSCGPTANFNSAQTGKIVLRAEPNYTVAVFEPGELTRCIVPGPTGSPSAGGRWEVAYVGSNGPRFLAFDAPTMALFPGVLDESFNAFLRQAGLDDKIGLELTAPRPVNANEAKQSPVRRARPKGRG
jgi:hypothetical protein